MRILTFIVFSFFNLSVVHSQELSSIQFPQNPEYINKLASKWSLRFYGVSKYDQFLFSGKNFASSYKPDVKFSTGIGVSYKNLTLDLATNFLSTDRSHRSRNISLLSSVYSVAHLFEITIQLYHRYSTDIYDSSHTKIHSLFRPDIHTFNLGVNYNYNFNHTKFSFDASSIGTQIQLHSAGTPLAGIYLSYFDIAADSFLISPVYAQQINTTNNITEANILSGGITAGYAYTLVLPKHFYIMLSATPKLGLHSPEIKTDFYRTTPINMTPGLLIRSAVGFAGKKIYAFLLFNADYNYINIGSGNRISYDPVKAKLLIGYRFKTGFKKMTRKNEFKVH